MHFDRRIYFFSLQEGDAIDEELDKQEILEPGFNELTGEELLEKEYVIVSATKKGSTHVRHLSKNQIYNFTSLKFT